VDANKSPPRCRPWVPDCGPAAKPTAPKNTPPTPQRNSLSNHEYLLAEIRLARTWADIWRSQIDTVGIALKSRWITPEKAVEELLDCPFFVPLVDGGGK
jgi:hypothetical protein